MDLHAGACHVARGAGIDAAFAVLVRFRVQAPFGGRRADSAIGKVLACTVGNVWPGLR